MRKNTDEVERLYRISQAAERLELKEATIRKWLLLRKIGYVKLGGAVRIPESELQRLMKFVPARE